MDVDLGLVGQQLGDAGGVVGQVGHLVIVGVAAERLEQDPEEVGEDAVGAGALCVPNVVVHVGHTAGEGKHDDEEGDEEHADILHHCIDAQDDRTKIFGSNSNLDDLYDCKSERNSPEDSSCRAECGDLRVSPADNVVNNLDHETNHEEQIHDDVVVVPESKVSFLKSLLVWTGTLEAPEEESGAEVPHGVGDDEDQHEELDDVDEGRGGLRDVADDQGDEDDVGEGGVDAPVERDTPLLAEPGRGVAAVSRLAGIHAGVEKRVEGEKKVAGNLLQDMQQSGLSGQELISVRIIYYRRQPGPESSVRALMINYGLTLTFEPGTCQQAKLCDRGHIHPLSQFGLHMTNDQVTKFLKVLNQIIIIHMQFSSDTSNATKSKVYEGINIGKYAAAVPETNKKSTCRRSKYVR